MKKVLYHGSFKEFNSFVIKKELARHKEDVLVEGYGIYMTEDITMAKDYGSNLYIVEVDSKDIFDTTSKSKLLSIIKKVSKSVGVDILSNINFNDLSEGVMNGNISVSRLYQEINMLLELNQNFYLEYEHLITLDENCLFEKIKEAYLEIIPSVLKYYDGSFKKEIYVCVKNPERLVIKEIIKEVISD